MYLCYSTIYLGVWWEHASESYRALWCEREVMMMSRADCVPEESCACLLLFQRTVMGEVVVVTG